MKKLLAILVLLAIVAGVLLLLKKTPSKENSVAANGVPSRSSSNSAVAWTVPPVITNHPAPISNPSTDLASRAASPNPSPDSTTTTNEPPALPPLTVLDKARVVIHNYHAAFGENPVGTNPEIAAVLQGKNPRQINFLAESGLRLNEKGEIIDGYGTPFFFHQISGQEMEIRSAGADRAMWTPDDLITK